MQKQFLEILQPFQFPINFSLSTTDLSHFKKLAQKYNMLPLYYIRLQRYIEDGARDEVVHDFLQSEKQVIFQMVAASIPQQEAEKKLVAVLQAENIQVAILKGSTIAESIYHNTNSRFSCDIDLLVKEEDIHNVDSILTKNNYRQESAAPLSFLQHRLHHATYTVKDSLQPIPVEIHWNFSIPGFFNLTAEQIWQQIEENNKDESYRLSPQMNLILLLMHHHRHSFKQLRNVVDLLWGFYRYNTQINWEVFAEEIRRIHMQKVVRTTILQIESLWPQAIQKLNGLQHLKKHIKKSTLLPISFPLNSLVEFGDHDAPLTVKDKIVYRLTLDNPTTIIYSFIKSIVPSPKTIHELYTGDEGILKKYIRYFRWRFLN